MTKCSVCGEVKERTPENFPTSRGVYQGNRCTACNRYGFMQRSEQMGVRQALGMEDMIRTCKYCGKTVQANKYNWITSYGAVIGFKCRECKKEENLQYWRKIGNVRRLERKKKKEVSQ